MRLFKKPDISKMGVLRFLPSKKFGVSLLVLLCLFLSYSLLFSSNGLINKLSARLGGKNTAGNQQALRVASMPDSDSDGLPDWEESLWHTDPRNPDTDGDGTKDGDEIKQNRNPLVAGPNDLLSATATVVDSQRLASSTDSNLTASMSKDLFKKYMTAQQVTGATKIDQQTEGQIVDSVMSSANLQNEPSQIFTAQDIKITTDNSVDAIRKYGNTTGAIVEKYSAIVSPLDDAFTAKDAILNSDAEKLSTLAKSIDSYQEVLSYLQKVIVPSSLQNNHLAILNSFSAVKENTKAVSLFFDDPLRAAVAINKQGNDIRLMIGSFMALNGVFEERGIFFKSDEPGFFIQSNVNSIQI